MYKCLSQVYWLPWLANACLVDIYRPHVLATSARVLYCSSVVLNGKRMAAAIRQKKDSAVSGRSSSNVYFRSNAVVTTLYAAGALSFSATY